MIQNNQPILDITGFIFHMSTRVKAEVRITKAFTCLRMRKKKPVISNIGHLFCFNSNVSNLYNNDAIIHKIKISRENSFVCERVYLIFPLQHWSNS